MALGHLEAYFPDPVRSLLERVSELLAPRVHVSDGSHPLGTEDSPALPGCVCGHRVDSTDVFKSEKPQDGCKRLEIHAQREAAQAGAGRKHA